MPDERRVEFRLDDDVKIQFNRSGRPISRYSVLLMVLVDGVWQTVRLFDNHLGTHHVHRYTQEAGKQGPETFHPGPNNEAIAAAIIHLRAHWGAILESWKS